jgi:hypothetical protein
VRPVRPVVLVHTALLADATWLIADDRKHISIDPDGATEYALPGSDRRVAAVTFSRSWIIT